MLAALERVGKLTVAIGKRSMRIDVARRAIALRDVGQRHLLSAKLVILVTEIIVHVIFSGQIEMASGELGVKRWALAANTSPPCARSLAATGLTAT